MNLTSLNDTLEWLILIGAALAVIATWLRWLRPWWRSWRADIRAARDALLGRDATYDSITGEERDPALPGIGKRMAVQEESLGALTTTVAQLAEVVAHQSRLDEIVGAHEGRISALEQAAVERLAAKAESIAAYRVMEAALDATPPDAEQPK